MLFTHLHLHTEYSLLDGVCRVEQLVALCGPTVSKPAFNHRMRKLMELAGGDGAS